MSESIEIPFKSRVVLGERYRDSFTGLEGTATALTFYVHGCERVTIEYLKEGEVKYESFDAPRLIHVNSNVGMTTTRTRFAWWDGSYP